MGIVHSLAAFIAGTNFEGIPDYVIENQKKSVMDAVGVTLGASTLGDGCREMVDIARMLSAGGRGEAVVIGFGERLPTCWAAFANASMAHSLDFGDTHQRSTIHSNSSSFPAALAVAESMGEVDGKKLLTALVLGSETAIRIALAADRNTVDDGFYIPTIYSSYGATAAVAKLMGLNEQQIISAFSFNLCQSMCSSELTNNKKTAVRSVREAFAARNAIISCCMAQENMAGFADPLEGRLGFYHTFLKDEYTAARATKELGKHWESSELTYKVWPCCFGNHSPVTALLEMMHEHELSAGDIQRMHISVGAQNIALLEPIEQRRCPDTAIVAKFSIPYNLAYAAVYGNLTIDSYSEDAMRDEKVRALAKKVDYTYREDWQRGRETWAELKLTTDKGSFESFVTMPLGTPEKPMSTEDFEKKFDSCASKAAKPMSARQLQELKRTIMRLERLDNISELTALL